MNIFRHKFEIQITPISPSFSLQGTLSMIHELPIHYPLHHDSIMYAIKIEVNGINRKISELKAKRDAPGVKR
jgi:hypothetical protein